MMTSSNGNIFRVTGPLCGEFTGPGEFPTQRPVTQSFDVNFDLRLNKRLSKQPWGWWFETPSWSLWRHCNDGVTSQHGEIIPCPLNGHGITSPCCDVTPSLFKLLFHSQTSTAALFEVWEWICDLIHHFMNDVIIYPCWKWNWSLLVKGERSKNMMNTAHQWFKSFKKRAQLEICMYETMWNNPRVRRISGISTGTCGLERPLFLWVIYT